MLPRDGISLFLTPIQKHARVSASHGARWVTLQALPSLRCLPLLTGPRRQPRSHSSALLIERSPRPPCVWPQRNTSGCKNPSQVELCFTPGSLLVNLQELLNTVYEPVNAPCHKMAPGAENNVPEIYCKPFNRRSTGLWCGLLQGGLYGRVVVSAGRLSSFLHTSAAASSPSLPWLHSGQRSWQLACTAEMDTSLEPFAAPEPKSLTFSWSHVLAFHCKNQTVVIELGQLLLTIN